MIKGEKIKAKTDQEKITRKKTLSEAVAANTATNISDIKVNNLDKLTLFCEAKKV